MTSRQRQVSSYLLVPEHRLISLEISGNSPPRRRGAAAGWLISLEISGNVNVRTLAYFQKNFRKFASSPTHEVLEAVLGPNDREAVLRVNPPNLNHGQNTRANRTRHTTSSSTQSHAKQQHTNATRHSSRSHAHTHKTLPPHSLSPPHARAHPPGESSPARSPPTSPPAPPPAASPAALSGSDSPACMRGFCGEARQRRRLSCRVWIDRHAWRATAGGRLPGGRRGRARARPPLGGSGPRGSEGGGAAAAHWLPTRPPSTGAAAEMMYRDVRRTENAQKSELPARVPCRVRTL